MEIIYKSYHGIDVVNDNIVHRDISGYFDDIIIDMLQKIVGNSSEKRYKIETERAIVANIIADIVAIEPDEEDSLNRFDEFSDEIANKLLREEKIVQANMEHLNGVQKGSLIQALIKSANGKYNYLIAKVEHTKYVDEDDLLLKGGFNPEENKIWKTAIFSCDILDEIIDVSEARVYLNHPAVYWTRNFLELIEMRSDEVNTREAWKNMEALLNTSLKKKFPSDYFTLRSAVITYFRRPRTIIYEDMVNEIFGEFEPIDASKDEISKVKEKLQELPTVKKFDTNFESKPKEIKAKIKSVHKVNNAIDLVVKAGLEGSVNSYGNTIHSEITTSGERRIVIKVTEDETFRLFKLKSN